MPIRIRTQTLLICCAMAVVPAAAAAQSDAPGDSYLSAIRLNPGDPAKPDPLPAAGAAFSVDTTSYGTQADIYNPPRSGGILEPNRCPPTRYGKTAWAWLYTKKWVRADVRASGAFDSVLAVMPFTSPTKPKLSPGSGACVNRSTATTEDFGDDQPILAPGWFALQAGGIEDASGQPTGGKLDVTVALREPPRLTAQVSAAGKRQGAGAAVDLSVNAPRGARLAFSCARRDCSLPGRRTVSRAGKRKYLNGRVVPNGARLELRVTRVGYIGDYFAWAVKGGRLGRVSTRCLEPASTRPQKRCDG
jgi:hypothetical protein